MIQEIDFKLLGVIGGIIFFFFVLNNVVNYLCRNLIYPGYTELKIMRYEEKLAKRETKFLEAVMALIAEECNTIYELQINSHALKDVLFNVRFTMGREELIMAIIAKIDSNTEKRRDIINAMQEYRNAKRTNDGKADNS